MKKILIISPHFPPSNLAAVHRSRLFARHLPGFGWEPVILMVDEKYYEEKPDYNLKKLLPVNLRIEKAAAFPVTTPRLIGDIGLRAFFQLYRKAKELINKGKVDFLYIPIPSFYCALLGRWLHSSTKIKYGIDYIDPWVHYFPGSDKVFSRHWLSTQVARLLEPIAVKKASLITGVAAGYYEGVLKRNPHLLQHVIFGAMPYGGEASDHDALAALKIKPYLFQKKPGKVQLVYAGAMLPKAYLPLEAIFKSVSANAKSFRHVEFHFIGTGKRPNDPYSYNIKPLAEKYKLWQSVVYEYPQRIPYLDVLVHLDNADGVFILGSTEPHYTPSKAYQGVLSKKPIVAVLHTQSTAVDVIKNSGAGVVLPFEGEKEIGKIEAGFDDLFGTFMHLKESYSPEEIDVDLFDKYSSRSITGELVTLLDKVFQNHRVISTSKSWRIKNG